MSSIKNVKVYPNSITIKTGDWYYEAKAEVVSDNPIYRNVKWYSNNTEVATVNTLNGHIYARSAGSATIYARSTEDGRKKDYITVTVTDKDICATSVTMNKTSLSLKVGKTAYLKATINPENVTTRKIEWHSSDSNIVMVTDGKVVANAVGDAYIYAETQDGSGEYGLCFIRVTDDILVTTVCISPSSKTMTVGGSMNLRKIITPKDASDQRVKWSSSDPDIVAVNADSGLVYALKKGKAQICAKATDESGQKGYCNITVNDVVYVRNIEVSHPSITLNKGETVQLYAEIYPLKATNKKIRWLSDDANIVKVSANTGTVTAESSGRTLVYACSTDGSGEFAYCDICVI